MGYVIAGALLVAAVAILTLPWSRRDPADFSLIELGYAWRGPRGAVVGALRVLGDLDVVRRSRSRGMVRTDKPLPVGIDPFARAVYGGLDQPRGPAALQELRSVEQKLGPVAERVLGAGLRVGPARRALGSLAALLAPVVALAALVLDSGDVVLGIAVSVVTVVVAGWLATLRGVTIAGNRTLGTQRGAEDDAVGAPTQLEVPLRVLVAEFGAADGGFRELSDFGGGGDPNL